MFHILVADDDRNTRRYMQAVLEDAHYTVTTAKDGAEALDILGWEHIDLIVLDVMMPEMDGYELTRELREAQDNIPILMVSARQEMLLRIRALLRRAKIVSEQKIVIGDVVLDYNSMTVTGHGQTQELPQKEFLLLYKLLSYPGQIFTRIQLMDEIWGVDSDTGWETVTVHIGRLRKRFAGWEEFEIISVRGLGYKAVKKV